MDKFGRWTIKIVSSNSNQTFYIQVDEPKNEPNILHFPQIKMNLMSQKIHTTLTNNNNNKSNF